MFFSIYHLGFRKCFGDYISYGITWLLGIYIGEFCFCEIQAKYNITCYWFNQRIFSKSSYKLPLYRLLTATEFILIGQVDCNTKHRAAICLMQLRKIVSHRYAHRSVICQMQSLILQHKLFSCNELSYLTSVQLKRNFCEIVWLAHLNWLWRTCKMKGKSNRCWALFSWLLCIDLTANSPGCKDWFLSLGMTGYLSKSVNAQLKNRHWIRAVCEWGWNRRFLQFVLWLRVDYDGFKKRFYCIHQINYKILFVILSTQKRFIAIMVTCSVNSPLSVFCLFFSLNTPLMVLFFFWH